MIEPLDPKTAVLLRDAKLVHAPADAQARVAQRLRSSLAFLAQENRAQEPQQTPTSMKASRSHAPTPWRLPRIFATRVPLWSLPLTLLAGVGLGAVVGPSLSAGLHAKQSVPYVQTAPVKVALPPEAVILDAGQSMSFEELPMVPRANGDAPPAGDLAKERALLDVARTALGRGDGAHAFEAAGHHERVYPHGVLTEEREALAIQALAQQGDLEGAKTRAHRFEIRYPKSVLLPAIQAIRGSKDSRERSD
jgi:hypothetical protein